MAARKVLVVTNDDAFGDSIRALVDKEADVKITHTRDEALDCATLGCPDLVLLDHDSALFDCIDLIAITRALRCRFGCALVTSRPSQSLMASAAEESITHVLTKPVSAETLAMVLLRPDREALLPPHQHRGGFTAAHA
jgi:DNA-binding response OmpR family regulator